MPVSLEVCVGAAISAMAYAETRVRMERRRLRRSQRLEDDREG